MKFPKATLITLCALSCLAVLPSLTYAQSSSSTKGTATPSEGSTSSKPSPHPTASSAPSSTSTAPSNPATSVGPKPITTTSSRQPVPTGGPSSTLPPVATSTPGVVGSTCVNSSTCGELLCALSPTSTDMTTGTCQAMPQQICQHPQNQTSCTTSSDCGVAYSLCSVVDGKSICTGLGTPGVDYCPDRKKDNPDSLTPTIKYAGIAVGCVAALGLLFALVRWQRRRQRSVPENMFGEVDYGMTDRGTTKTAEQNYPFSSRPHAHGSDHAPTPHDNGGYDNNYYDDGYQKDQYYGNDHYNNNQYYGNQHDNYGYDHHSGHGGQGGFYDNVDYNDGYQNGGRHSPITSPAAAAMSPRQNHYGAEPSEQDYNGHGYGGRGGHGGQGGYY